MQNICDIIMLRLLNCTEDLYLLIGRMSPHRDMVLAHIDQLQSKLKACTCFIPSVLLSAPVRHSSFADGRWETHLDAAGVDILLIDGPTTLIRAVVQKAAAPDVHALWRV
jgi:hypothetical protein